MSARAHQSFNMFGKNINFYIHSIAWCAMPKSGDFRCMWNDRNFKCVFGEIENCEADAVDCAAAFFHDITHELFWNAHHELWHRSNDFAHRINMAKNNVATKATIGHHGPLKVDRVARLQIAKVGA